MPMCKSWAPVMRFFSSHRAVLPETVQGSRRGAWLPQLPEPFQWLVLQLHRIIEYPDVARAQQDHESPGFGPAQDGPKFCHLGASFSLFGYEEMLQESGQSHPPEYHSRAGVKGHNICQVARGRSYSCHSNCVDLEFQM